MVIALGEQVLSTRCGAGAPTRSVPVFAGTGSQGCMWSWGPASSGWFVIRHWLGLSAHLLSL